MYAEVRLVGALWSPFAVYVDRPRVIWAEREREFTICIGKRRENRIPYAFLDDDYSPTVINTGDPTCHFSWRIRTHAPSRRSTEHVRTGSRSLSIRSVGCKLESRQRETSESPCQSCRISRIAWNEHGDFAGRNCLRERFQKYLYLPTYEKMPGFGPHCKIPSATTTIAEVPDGFLTDFQPARCMLEEFAGQTPTDARCLGSVYPLSICLITYPMREMA
jgi:hypothetical protein